MNDLRRVRVRLVVLTLVLLGVGTVMIYSASAIFAYERYGDSLYFIKRHLMAMALGGLAMVGVLLVSLERWQRWARPALLVSLASLVLLLLPGVGHGVGGAVRWFRLGGWSVQPSELAKLGLILFLADLAARRGRELNQMRTLVGPLCVVGGGVLLLLLQPDMGRATEFVVLLAIMLFVAGLDVRAVATAGMCMLPALYWLVWSVPYRRERITGFLNPWANADGSGFQLVQATLAFASGELLGVGLGRGVQKLYYLPEAHTDFILAIIGEELGLLGTAGVVLLIGAWVWQGCIVAIKTSGRFGSYLAFGVTLLIGLEAVVNFGVATGTLPTKGLPLPFISYGGSAMVANLVALAWLLNASRSTTEAVSA